MAVLSGILWFKVVERYPLDGSPRSHKRRDLRRGLLAGSAHITLAMLACLGYSLLLSMNEASSLLMVAGSAIPA